jgi:hypothetical protein
MNRIKNTERNSADLLEVIRSVNGDPRAIQTVNRLALISAPLGVLLDNQHGLFGVLRYEAFQVNVSLADGTPVLKSAFWVPFLFAFAGWIMSYLQLVADRYYHYIEEGGGSRMSSTSHVLYGISAFSSLYYLSGLLDSQGVEPLTINLVLSALAVAGFVYFDGTTAGFTLAVATAISGPIAEIALTSSGLYTYVHADVLRIASWIPAVYFLGGSAVGNLTRWMYNGAVEKDE